MKQNVQFFFKKIFRPGKTVLIGWHDNDWFQLAPLPPKGDVTSSVCHRPLRPPHSFPLLARPLWTWMFVIRELGL